MKWRKQNFSLMISSVRLQEEKWTFHTQHQALQIDINMSVFINVCYDAGIYFLWGQPYTGEECGCHSQSFCTPVLPVLLGRLSAICWLLASQWVGVPFFTDLMVCYVEAGNIRGDIVGSDRQVGSVHTSTVCRSSSVSTLSWWDLHPWPPFSQSDTTLFIK